MKCRIDKRNAWADRILFECLKTNGRNSFVTLTYDDEHRCEDGSLHKEEMQKFHKRLRKNSGKTYKHYTVGEYGGQFGRENFHIIFMGLDYEEDKSEIVKAWQGRGMVKVLPLTAGGIRYVLKYIDKQIHGEQAKEIYGEKQPPYAQMSQGIGKDYLAEHREYIEEHGGYYYKGKIRPMSKYYRDLILMSKEADTKRLEETLEKLKKGGFKNETEMEKSIGRVQEKHLITTARNGLEPIDSRYLRNYEPCQGLAEKLAEEAL